MERLEAEESPEPLYTQEELEAIADLLCEEFDDFYHDYLERCRQSP